MSVVYQFHTAPAIKNISPDILKQFIGLQVPINTLEMVGKLGAEHSTTAKKQPKFLDFDVVMTKEALILAAFSQKKYDLGHFLNSYSVQVDTFVVDGKLVSEVQ